MCGLQSYKRAPFDTQAFVKSLYTALSLFSPQSFRVPFLWSISRCGSFFRDPFSRGAIPGRKLMVSNLAPSSCHSKPPFGKVAIRNNPSYFWQVLRYNIRYTRFIKNVVKMQRAFCFNNFILITQYPCLN